MCAINLNNQTYCNLRDVWAVSREPLIKSGKLLTEKSKNIVNKILELINKIIIFYNLSLIKNNSISVCRSNDKNSFNLIN